MWLQVERLLDGVDAVLYLLDYTKLKTQDEAAIFERLKQVMICQGRLETPCCSMVESHGQAHARRMVPL